MWTNVSPRSPRKAICRGLFCNFPNAVGWNACKGIPTERLEDIKTELAASLIDEVNRLRKALELITDPKWGGTRNIEIAREALGLQ